MSLERERRFWDAQAQLLAGQAARREAELMRSDPLWAWMVAELAGGAPGPALDLGCGRGATTLLLAETGAAVVGLDLSHDALRLARELLASHPGASVVTALAERLPFRDRVFPRVVGRFVLHHAESLEASAVELRRVMAAGGRGVFIETWGRNPLLRVGRRVAGLLGVGFGTADERPLRPGDLALLRRHFAVTVVFPHFTAFELLNRVLRRLKPLAARSRLVRALLPRVWRLAIGLDRWIDRSLPFLRPWGWFVGLILEPKPDD